MKDGFLVPNSSSVVQYAGSDSAKPETQRQEGGMPNRGKL